MHMAHTIYHLFELVPVCDNISRWSRIMLENNDAFSGTSEVRLTLQ